MTQSLLAFYRHSPTVAAGARRGVSTRPPKAPKRAAQKGVRAKTQPSLRAPRPRTYARSVFSTLLPPHPPKLRRLFPAPQRHFVAQTVGLGSDGRRPPTSSDNRGRRRHTLALPANQRFPKASHWLLWRFCRLAAPVSTTMPSESTRTGEKWGRKGAEGAVDRGGRALPCAAERFGKRGLLLPARPSSANHYLSRGSRESPEAVVGGQLVAARRAPPQSSRRGGARAAKNPESARKPRTNRRSSPPQHSLHPPHHLCPSGRDRGRLQLRPPPPPLPRAGSVGVACNHRWSLRLGR